MFDYERLRAVIREAIGDETQKEFAAKCGMSIPHLNRLMNGDSPSRPYKSTLKKMSSYTNATYEELLVMCGYETSPLDARQKKRPEERAELNARDMETGFREMTKCVRPYDSIRDFLEEHIMLYSTEHVIARHTEPQECNDNRAEYYTLCYFEFSNDEYKCRTWFVIYFYTTHSGKIFITDVGMEAEDMVYAGMTELAKLTETENSKEEHSPYVYRIVYRKSSEERMLEAIFRDTYGEEYPTSVVGFGFKYDRTPETFDNFLESHKDTLQFIPQKNVLDKTQTYQTGMLIAAVMREETGLQYAYYQGDTGPSGGCIMVCNYELDDVKEATRAYAKELGYQKYGECVVLTTAVRNKNLEFNVEEEA